MQNKMSLSEDRQQKKSIYQESGANKSHGTTVEPKFIGRSGIKFSQLHKFYAVRNCE